MATLDDIAAEKSVLTAQQLDRLRALVADWQLVADLAFSDAVLWIADAESRGHWAAAQIRPTTGPTTLSDDVVGNFLSNQEFAAFGADNPGARFHFRVVPVVVDGNVIAQLTLQWHNSELRTAGTLEQVYTATSEVLLDMIMHGEYPLPGTRSEIADTLRVGDGFIRTDETRRVTFASPNAMSAYRRLGLTTDLVGHSFTDVTMALLERRPTDRSVATLLGTDEAESELESHGVTLLLRVVPLLSGGAASGHVVLLRDVSELRLRERQLVSKEATIREIHHRVKNNLQTVAALLRLQARRLQIPEARLALQEAERRIGSIALVHETLSQTFDDNVLFDDVADTLLRTVPEVGTGTVVRTERIGTFGTLSGESAMSIAMILTELLQNAVEHAFDGRPGRIIVAVNRIRGLLKLRVTDNGRGLPDDFNPQLSLGLSIVSTLVESELAGTLRFEPAPGGGTVVVISCQLQ